MPEPTDDSLILCATSRLAQSLRWQDNRARAAAGDRYWATLNTATIAQWFASLAEEAVLRGQVAESSLLARRVLDAFQASQLWERVIAESIPDHAASFFDLSGMAASAAEAHELMVVWGIDPAGVYATDETQEFLRWRRKYLDLCTAHGLVDAARAHEAALALITGGALRLPGDVRFAGFDNLSPQERRLQHALRDQRVRVADFEFAAVAAPRIEVRGMPDAELERRAIAQWVAAQLAADPAAQLGIVVPNLGATRDALEAALDDAVHPALLRPGRIEAPRLYNFSLGKPLDRHPMVAAALDLVELACGAGEVEQSRIGELLRHPCWSASLGEVDARARLEAAMREHLPATTSVARVLGFARRFDSAPDDDGPRVPARLPQLLGHLQAIESARAEWKKKALPSAWAGRIRQLLRAAGWPGERSLSSHEFQARHAFHEELERLAALDGILDNVPAREARRALAQLCNAHVFQAETAGEPQVQVVGMLEAGGMRFDALWVMGMTDDVWPPAPRPNPLLPAELQRRAGAPNASASVQLAFATSIHQRLLRCAPRITFSFAHMEGATGLRPSPLLAVFAKDRVVQDTAFPSFAPGAGGDSPVAWASAIDDSVAPPVREDEHVSGGTGLLKAQAICPAWAYFRYRLGARQLPTPVDGLDPAARGSIVHEALRVFWRGAESSAILRAMAEAERAAAIDLAVDAALDQYDERHRAAPLPPVFRALERERLQRLLGNWLAVELQREQPFSVLSCEERVRVDIEGIGCDLQIDRVDALEDGRRIVIDYKTGAVGSPKGWAALRITDPQLPIYAAIALPAEATAAVAFGRVLLDDAQFLGIAADDGLLPKVPGVDSRDGRKLFGAEAFADWAAVLRHWHTSIRDIAHEVKVGAAAVMAADEADLRYCEVRPLLRLAERRAQWEAGLGGGRVVP